MARCGLCRKEIRWSSTTELVRMAVDFRPHPEGTVYIFPRDHKFKGLFRVLDAEEVERAKKAGYPLWRKHSGNCPAMSKRKPEDQIEFAL